MWVGTNVTNHMRLTSVLKRIFGSNFGLEPTLFAEVRQALGVSAPSSVANPSTSLGHTEHVSLDNFFFNFGNVCFLNFNLIGFIHEFLSTSQNNRDKLGDSPHQKEKNTKTKKKLNQKIQNTLVFNSTSTPPPKKKNSRRRHRPSGSHRKPQASLTQVQVEVASVPWADYRA